MEILDSGGSVRLASRVHRYATSTGPLSARSWPKNASIYDASLYLTEQMAAGLMAVHARGIVHRDLKPENMIVLGAGTSAERLVIIDFGTASLRTGEGRLAATTLMAGSFHYMAPERLSGHFSLASDIFSFAVVIPRDAYGVETVRGGRAPFRSGFSTRD